MRLQVCLEVMASMLLAMAIASLVLCLLSRSDVSTYVRSIAASSAAAAAHLSELLASCAGCAVG